MIRDRILLAVVWVGAAAFTLWVGWLAIDLYHKAFL